MELWQLKCIGRSFLLGSAFAVVITIATTSVGLALLLALLVLILSILVWGGALSSSCKRFSSTQKDLGEREQEVYRNEGDHHPTEPE
jgi:VIT1/CCC1 family predicted Fe2+/Mn2+ transporter